MNTDKLNLPPEIGKMISLFVLIELKKNAPKLFDE
jgi:hypothetical protein